MTDLHKPAEWQARQTAIRDSAGFYPRANDALAPLDAYAWHPLYDDATDAVELAYVQHGGIEAMARAEELRRMFDTMCGVTAGTWG